MTVNPTKQHPVPDPKRIRRAIEAAYQATMKLPEREIIAARLASNATLNAQKGGSKWDVNRRA